MCRGDYNIALSLFEADHVTGAAGMIKTRIDRDYNRHYAEDVLAAMAESRDRNLLGQNVQSDDVLEERAAILASGGLAHYTVKVQADIDTYNREYEPIGLQQTLQTFGHHLNHDPDFALPYA